MYRCSVFLIAACMFGVLIGGCGEASPDIQADTSTLESLEEEIEAARTDLSAEALTYLESALDTIQVHHAIGPEHDWEEWRLVVLERARGAESPSDTYDALWFALNDLPGGHPSFQEPSAAEQSIRDASPQGNQATPSGFESLHAELIGGRFGLVAVPTFLSTDAESVNTFASELQTRIRGIDVREPCGWIVDIRQNAGGNMWPMVAGLGPLLGNGRVGSVATRDGIAEQWSYSDGEARLDTLVLASVDEPYVIEQPLPPVALLTSELTGSSGEAVAVAFRGRAETLFLGAETGGATSSPVFFELKDGVVIGFAGSFLADREGNVYKAPIEPDRRVDGDPWNDPDRVKAAAIEWLNEQPGC